MFCDEVRLRCGSMGGLLPCAPPCKRERNKRVRGITFDELLHISIANLKTSLSSVTSPTSLAEIIAWLSPRSSVCNPQPPRSTLAPLTNRYAAMRLPTRDYRKPRSSATVRRPHTNGAKQDTMSSYISVKDLQHHFDVVALHAISQNTKNGCPDALYSGRNPCLAICNSWSLIMICRGSSRCLARGE